MNSITIPELSARKIALMSDIHGNFHAFRTCFDDAVRQEEWAMRLLNRVLEAGDPQDEALWRSAAMAMGMRDTEEEILDFWRSRTLGK